MSVTAAPPEQRPAAALSPLLPLIAALALGAAGSAAVFSRWAPQADVTRAPAAAHFEDVTERAGLPAPDPDAGTGRDPDAPTTLSGAVAFLDADGDGHPDLLYLSPPHWPWHLPAADTSANCALFRNDGHGHFSDVTAASGLEAPVMPMAVAVGDYANEGRPDIFITGIGGNRLFHNLGGGRFEDVTDAAGVRGDPNVWSMGAVWIDFDGDGRLDLVVCNYARWPRESDLRAALADERAGFSYSSRGGFVSCFPTLYRNLGGGRFADVTRGSGLELIDRQTGRPRAYPLAVAAVDADGDGRLDLLFTYQSGGDALFLNTGHGFRLWSARADRREGLSVGLAGASGATFAAGPAEDARLAALQSAGLIPPPGADESEPACRLRTHLGGVLLDYDLDGRLDFFSSEGVAEAALGHFDAEAKAPPPALLWNAGGQWVAAPLAHLPPGPRPRFRGVAAADVDGDGSVALAVGIDGGTPRLLRNERVSHHAYLRVDLVGTRTQRDGGGARVEVHTPRAVLTQTMAPAMSFLGQSESTLTFGLGEEGRVSRVVVRWPSGVRQEVRAPGINRRIVITEPSAP